MGLCDEGSGLLRVDSNATAAVASTSPADVLTGLKKIEDFLGAVAQQKYSRT
jgi:hypothetical protein